MQRHIAGQTVMAGQQGEVIFLDGRFLVGGHINVQHDLGVQLAEPRNQRCQHMGGQYRCGQHPQHARQLAGLCADGLIGLVDVLQDDAHPAQVVFARRAERQATRGAVQKPRAEVGFQVGHQPGHDGRRHVQGACCSRKAPFVDDLLKNPH